MILHCSAFDISAKSAILYEPETQTVLFKKNISEKREIASTTKIMTAVVVLENADINDVVSVPASCVGIEGTSMYLKEGEKLTVSELLYGMLLQSGNDAATTLAHYVGNGNIANFVELMNSTAKKIGLSDSHFKNPSGLPDKEHYSTAYDMAKLATYAMEIPEFCEIVSTKVKNVAGRTLSNHNKLLRIYDGANGLKTGFTKAAGRCLVSGAKRDGMQLIAVTLYAPDDWNDHKELFDFGFSNFEIFRETKELNDDTEISVVGGDVPDISANIDEEITLLKEKNGKLTRVVYAPRFLYAPIKQGEVVGRAEYLIDGELIKTTPLISCDDVSEKRPPTLIERIAHFFQKYILRNGEYYGCKK